MSPWEHVIKNSFSVVTIIVIPRTLAENFMRKYWTVMKYYIILICQNRPQNTSKCPYEERDMMSKNILVLVIIRVIPRNLRNISWENIERISRKNMYICKNRSQNTLKCPQQMERHDVKSFLSVVTMTIIPTVSWKNIEQFEVLDKHCSKWALKYPPKAPQQGHDVEENSALTSRTSV